jgi:hypothetical protein
MMVLCCLLTCCTVARQSTAGHLERGHEEKDVRFLTDCNVNNTATGINRVPTRICEKVPAQCVRCMF